jgi:hypothetical protein
MLCDWEYCSDAFTLSRDCGIAVVCPMRTFLLLALLTVSVPTAKAAAPPPEIYASNFWEIPSPPDKTLWIEIHKTDEAKTSGIAHISVYSRKKGAPGWESKWVCAHIAITTEALLRSVSRPSKLLGLYPESYYEALKRWEDDQKKGQAQICTTSIQDWLKEHP